MGPPLESPSGQVRGAPEESGGMGFYMENGCEGQRAKRQVGYQLLQWEVVKPGQ